MMPDGRLVAVDVAGDTPDTGRSEIHVVLNWFEELAAKLGGK
jgi:hypothetical protein